MLFSFAGTFRQVFVVHVSRRRKVHWFIILKDSIAKKGVYNSRYGILHLNISQLVTVLTTWAALVLTLTMYSNFLTEKGDEPMTAKAIQGPWLIMIWKFYIQVKDDFEISIEGKSDREGNLGVLFWVSHQLYSAIFIQ